MLVSEEKISLEANKKNIDSCENCEEFLLALLWTLEVTLPLHQNSTLKYVASLFFWFTYTTDTSFMLRRDYTHGGGGKNGSII